LGEESVKHFTAIDGRLNDDGKLMFKGLIIAELPRVDEFFMPKIEVTRPEQLSQLELDLVNETYEHPTRSSSPRRPARQRSHWLRGRDDDRVNSGTLRANESGILKRVLRLR
jgi:hypothetical protein